MEWSVRRGLLVVKMKKKNVSILGLMEVSVRLKKENRRENLKIVSILGLMEWSVRQWLHSRIV